MIEIYDVLDVRPAKRNKRLYVFDSGFSTPDYFFSIYTRDIGDIGDIVFLLLLF